MQSRQRGGFYEWRKPDVADKQPFAFAMGNREIMTLAGLGGALEEPRGRPMAAVLHHHHD